MNKENRKKREVVEPPRGGRTHFGKKVERGIYMLILYIYILYFYANISKTGSFVGI